eukprot:SAG31_NODE_10154_length_1177_cov_1.365492_2_plen_177_part_00
MKVRALPRKVRALPSATTVQIHHRPTSRRVPLGVLWPVGRPWVQNRQVKYPHRPPRATKVTARCGNPTLRARSIRLRQLGNVFSSRFSQVCGTHCRVWKAAEGRGATGQPGMCARPIGSAPMKNALATTSRSCARSLQSTHVHCVGDGQQIEWCRPRRSYASTSCASTLDNSCAMT